MHSPKSVAALQQNTALCCAAGTVVQLDFFRDCVRLFRTHEGADALKVLEYSRQPLGHTGVLHSWATITAQ